MDPARRERLLRRRLRDIEDELGEGDPGVREVEELREKIEAAKLPDVARAQADRELQRLSALPQHAPDRHLIRTYVEWLADLPWSVRDRGQARPRGRAHRARRGPPRARQGEGPHPRVPRRAQARARREEPDPVLRRAARRRQDLARPLDRARDGARVRARVARRRARRGGDPRASPHLRRRDAGPDPPEPAPRRARATRCSCSTRSTSSAPISAAIRRRRCSRCSIRSRTTRSAITTSRSRSTSRR